MRGKVRLPHRQLACSWLDVSSRVSFFRFSRVNPNPWPYSVLFLLFKSEPQLVRLACLTLPFEKISTEEERQQLYLLPDLLICFGRRLCRPTA